jgi:hypothetical protein
LTNIDRGVRGDNEEPVHQRPACGIERGAGPPGPEEDFLDYILGQVGVDHDPARAGEQASVMRGVRDAKARATSSVSAAYS